MADTNACTAADVVTLGDPVVDVMMKVDDEFLNRMGCQPGGALTIDDDGIEALMAAAESSCGASRER